MLTEAQLAALPIPLQSSFQRLETDIIQRIASRIGAIGRVSVTDIHQLDELLRIGYDLEQIEKEIAATVGKSQKEVCELLRAAAEREYLTENAVLNRGRFVPFDENHEMQLLLESITRATEESFINLSRTTGFINARNSLGVRLPSGRFQPLAEYYQSVVDYAALQVRTGQTTFDQAMRATIRAMADRGFSSISYESGTVSRMDTAVRANLMDAQARLSLAQAELIGQQFGANGMEVSLHSAPRPSHVWIGGGQFPMDEFNRNVKPVMMEWNCYHRAWGIIIGVSPPAHTKAEIDARNARDAEQHDYKGKQYTAYKAQEKQREFETKIRQYKDRTIAFSASGDTEAAQSSRAHVRALQAEYARFSSAMNKPTSRARTRVSGYH